MSKEFGTDPGEQEIRKHDVLAIHKEHPIDHGESSLTLWMPDTTENIARLYSEEFFTSELEQPLSEFLSQATQLGLDGIGLSITMISPPNQKGLISLFAYTFSDFAGLELQDDKSARSQATRIFSQLSENIREVNSRKEAYLQTQVYLQHVNSHSGLDNVASRFPDQLIDLFDDPEETRDSLIATLIKKP